MVRKVGVSSSRGVSSSESDSSESTSGRVSAGSSTRSAFGDTDHSDAGSPEVQQLARNTQAGSSRSGIVGCIAGYDSEESVRDKIHHTRFSINHMEENRIDMAKLHKLATEFSIPRTVGLRIPKEGERASNPEGTSVAFHPAFLEIGARLPLQPYLRRVLREIGIAPAQLNPNGWRVLIGMYSLWKGMKYPPPTFAEIGHCYSLYSHKSGGDGWWALASRDKQGGEPLITGLPSSNKEWKKTWFVAGGNWGKDLRLGGKPQRVRSVFNIPGVWNPL